MPLRKERTGYNGSKTKTGFISFLSQVSKSILLLWLEGIRIRRKYETFLLINDTPGLKLSRLML